MGYRVGRPPFSFISSPPPPPSSAAHLLSDVLAFLISLFAVWVSQRPAAGRYSWGYHRWEVIGALASVALIWVLTAVLCLEAVNRLLRPEPVDGQVMFITASAGLLVNLLMMRVLHQGGGGHSHGGHSHGGGGHSHGGHDNLNVTAAYIHVLGDLVQSVGVMIAAVIVWAVPQAHAADPICTFIFSILVLFTTTPILRAAGGAILNAVPPYVSLPELARGLHALPGVTAVYALHVWEYGGAGDRGKVALSVRVVAPVEAHGAVLAGALRVAEGAGVTHPTVQVEAPGAGGALDPAADSLDVYAEGAEPRGRICADLARALCAAMVGLGGGGGGGGGGGAGGGAPLYRLAPPPGQGGGHSHGGALCSGGHSGEKHPPPPAPPPPPFRIVSRAPSARAVAAAGGGASPVHTPASAPAAIMHAGAAPPPPFASSSGGSSSGYVAPHEV